MDSLEWKKLAYLIIVDYYSKFMEIVQLDRATAEAVVQLCKNIFSRHGVLLYAMGDEAEDILESFRLSDDEQKSYRVGVYVIKHPLWCIQDASCNPSISEQADSENKMLGQG